MVRFPATPFDESSRLVSVKIKARCLEKLRKNLPVRWKKQRAMYLSG